MVKWVKQSKTMLPKVFYLRCWKNLFTKNELFKM